MSTVLGLNAAFHEDAAALVVDGELVAAVEEERLTRRKHAKRATLDAARQLPFHAIDAVLREGGAEPADVDWIAYSFDPFKRLTATSGSKYPYELTAGSWGTRVGEERFCRAVTSAIPGLGERYGPDFAERVLFLDHHLCHAASAFLVSPFERAGILVLDGIGETAGITLAHGEGREIRTLETIPYPTSLGFFWERMAQFCGFDPYNSSYLMGLAAYGGGSERWLTKVESLLPLGEGGFSARDDVLTFRNFEDTPGRDGLAALESHLDVGRRGSGNPMEAPYPDIAWAAQATLERRIQQLCERLWDLTGERALCLAGGVALNCVANGTLLDETPFGELWVQPAANDAGTALGAAVALEHQLNPARERRIMSHAYLGPAGIDRSPASVLADAGLQWIELSDIAEVVAGLLARGDVVGWFQGKMEFGPRALGNRSLLADPRNPEMRQVLNEKVKHRESFRPFCPAVLADEAQAWFDLPADTTRATEFMLYACRARSERSELVPAVVHVDGTARIQTVSSEHNPRFAELLQAFFRRTGVPMLLNTSFNDSEPIVCTIDDAIKTFCSTEIDWLVIDRLLASKPGRALPDASVQLGAATRI